MMELFITYFMYIARDNPQITNAMVYFRPSQHFKVNQIK